MKKYNAIIAAASVACGLLILFLSRNFHQVDSHGNPGEGFWPRLSAVLFIGLGVLLGGIAAVGGKDADRKVELATPAVRKAYAAFGLSTLYGILLLLAGFLIATFVFVPALMALMGERRPKIVAATAAGIGLGIWLVFMVGFKSTLPESIFLG